MELPAALRQAVDDALAGQRLSDLQHSADRLSTRYRAETRDGALHLGDNRAALGYIAARLPATYAAIRQSLEWTAEYLPDFAPRTQLDIGSGPGTAVWAAADRFETLDQATLLDASAPIRELGARLGGSLAIAQDWRGFDIRRDTLPEGLSADLVTLAYVLDELDPTRHRSLIAQAWGATRRVLLVVEPGTPAGWRRILDVRDILIEAGAQIAAPCPHQAACPLTAPDWCHFARRVARSAVHRQVKRGEVPWEDEKFIYLAATRLPIERFRARIIAPVHTGSGKASLKLCQADGQAVERLVTKREGEVFRAARRAAWGDGI